MMRILVLIVSIAGWISAEGGFYGRYAVDNVLRKCFGEEMRLEIKLHAANVTKKCQSLPVRVIYDDPDVPQESLGVTSTTKRPTAEPSPAGESGRTGTEGDIPEKRDILFNRDLLAETIEIVQAKISNYTCALQEMNLIDENDNINLFMFGIPEDELRLEVYDMMKRCNDMANCSPTTGRPSPLPKRIQRILSYIRCTKMARIELCMRRDIKKHISQFDLSMFEDPGYEIPGLNGQENIDGKVSYLQQLFWASETDEFDIGSFA